MATAMKRLGVYLGLVEDDPHYDGGPGTGTYGYREPAAAPRAVDTPASAPQSSASVSTLTRRAFRPRPIQSPSYRRRWWPDLSIRG